MSEKEMIPFILIIIIIFLLGFFSGIYFNDRYYKNELIKKHLGYYNSNTGEFVIGKIKDKK
jgi:hypothetical protein